MHTHAVHRIARAARAAGASTLRFQFRGVGLSAGVHTGGPGERDDARAALAWVAGQRPALPRLLAGFSFGGWVAAEVGCADPGVRGILCAGVAARSLAMGSLRSCPLPVAVIQGADDEFAAPEEIRALLQGSIGPRRCAVVPGASHLFTQALETLEGEARAAFEWLLEGVG
jgi:uncharacterized protein